MNKLNFWLTMILLIGIMGCEVCNKKGSIAEKINWANHNCEGK